jgi:hypothetical protein
MLMDANYNVHFVTYQPFEWSHLNGGYFPDTLCLRTFSEDLN